MKEDKYDIIVVGGGAAGMMAAGVAASEGKSVLLIEKNKRLGEKLSISGGGRCNITNDTPDIRQLLDNYGDAEQFLYSPFSQFGPEDSFSFFEKLNLPLVVEANQRAFPKSQKAADVVRALEQHMKTGNVKVISDTAISRVTGANGKITGVEAGEKTYQATSYILATGGVSHPETGSTGDGFGWLKELGHTIKEPTPSIVPLATKESWGHKLTGTSLSDIKITFLINGKKAFAKSGRILFTHFGISGPLILNSAKAVSDLLQEGEVTATIDCFPDTDTGSLEKKILEVFDDNKNKMFKNIFNKIAPDGTGKILLTLLPEIDHEKGVHSITKTERKQIAKLLKALPLTIKGLLGNDKAVVADGGVPLTEMDMKTMRSLLYKNLFITGDLLHINRPTGGFSLQTCWTTGYVAGINA